MPEHALAYTDSKCAFRGRIKVDLHACSSKLFYLSRQTFGVDVEGNGRGRHHCVVCSSSQPHNLSQTVYLVMETFLLMCHEMARPPQSCAALPTNPIKKTLRQGNTNKILFLLTLLVSAALYHPRRFFMKGGLSLDYHLTSCTHSSYQMLPCDMLCVFPPSLCDSMGCFLPLQLPPLHPHTNI